MEWVMNNIFLLIVLALCLGMHLLGGHKRHEKHTDKESSEHKNHAHSGSSGRNQARSEQSSCH